MIGMINGGSSGTREGGKRGIRLFICKGDSDLDGYMRYR